jgi:hypothetical protein
MWASAPHSHAAEEMAHSLVSVTVMKAVKTAAPDKRSVKRELLRCRMATDRTVVTIWRDRQIVKNTLNWMKKTKKNCLLVRINDCVDSRVAESDGINGGRSIYDWYSGSHTG